jgi:hypothetical protein
VIVPVGPVRASVTPDRPSPRPSAPFLAHVIATAQQAPQTRVRRRAEPAEAVAAYQGAPVAARVPPGFSRSL